MIEMTLELAEAIGKAALSKANEMNRPKRTLYPPLISNLR